MSVPAVRRPSLAALLGAAVLALAACGSEDVEEAATQAETAAEEARTAAEQATTPAQTGTAQELEVDAVEGSDGLGWDPESLSASAGEITITMANPQGNELPHAVSIEGTGVNENGNVVQPGSDTSTVTASLEAGEYVFYCPVGAHRQNGMQGTLTVE